MSTAKNDARLDFRLPAELKVTIERAAAQRGQSVGDFAISTLARGALEVIREHDVTELSDRDRDLFIFLLDDADASAKESLHAAANRYKEVT